APPSASFPKMPKPRAVASACTAASRRIPASCSPRATEAAMALRQTEEEQAVFDHALAQVAEQGPMAQEEVDSLSMLEGADLARFHDVWAKLPAGARARMLVALHGAAENRLRLDFS